MSISVEEYNTMEAAGEFDKSDVRCAECKYWLDNRAEDSGTCHRYPPVFDPSWLQEKIILRYDEFESETDGSYWALPVTDKHSFCGEHVSRWLKKKS